MKYLIQNSFIFLVLAKILAFDIFVCNSWLRATSFFSKDTFQSLYKSMNTFLRKIWKLSLSTKLLSLIYQEKPSFSKYLIFCFNCFCKSIFNFLKFILSVFNFEYRFEDKPKLISKSKELEFSKFIFEI